MNLLFVNLYFVSLMSLSWLPQCRQAASETTYDAEVDADADTILRNNCIVWNIRPLTPFSNFFLEKQFLCAYTGLP